MVLLENNNNNNNKELIQMEVYENTQIAGMELTRAIKEVTQDKGESVSLTKLYQEIYNVFKLDRFWVDRTIQDLIKEKHVIKYTHQEAGYLLEWVNVGS